MVKLLPNVIIYNQFYFILFKASTHTAAVAVNVNCRHWCSKIGLAAIYSRNETFTSTALWQYVRNLYA